ncbi:MAG: FHIPEP family type III secretion protein, partial [Anaerolineales bacterium]
SWIYVTRALINLKSQHLTLVQRAWEAVLYLECAILLWEDEAYRWAALGHFYRQLNGQANALVATARALEIEPDYLWAIEERLIVIANTGDYPEAYRLAKQYQAQQEAEQGPEAAAQDPWIKGVLVFVLRHLAHEDPNYLQEALTYLDEENPDPFYREQRALMHQQMGELDRTIAEYQKIWEAYDPLDEDNLVRYGYAGLMLGLLTDNPEPVDGAKFTFGKVLADPTQRNEAYFSLGLCELYLARRQSGQTAADSVQRGLDYLLKEGIKNASDARTLEDFREYDWQPFKQQYASPPSGLPETIWQQAVERVNTALENRLAELHALQSPVEELNQLTADLSREEDLDEIRRRVSEAAADATRVRLLKASGEWETAAKVAQRLAESADFFPEPERVQTGVVKGLEASGDQLILQGEPGLARLAYEQALKFMQQETAPITGEAAGLHSRLALMYLLGEQPGPAHEELTTALALTEDPEQASDLFADLAENLLQSPAEYWNLQDALEVCRVEFTQEGKTNLADALEAAREGSAAYLSHVFQMNEAEQDRTPLVTPVVVEYEQSLIPDESPLQQTFLQDYLPAMRTRIWEQWGVFVPGVNMRPNEDLTSEAYQILIEETPILMDWVYPEHVFAVGTPGQLAAQGVPESEQIQRQHPLTDQPGSWVPASYQASLAGQGVQLTAPFEMMVYELEYVLLQKLPAFLGVQETENLIFTWIEETHQVDQNQLFELLPDRNARVQFRQILRTLLDQQIPLTRPQDI